MRMVAPNKVVYQYDVGGREGEEEMEANPGFILYDAEVCDCVDERCGGVRVECKAMKAHSIFKSISF